MNATNPPITPPPAAPRDILDEPSPQVIGLENIHGTAVVTLRSGRRLHIDDEGIKVFRTDREAYIEDDGAVVDIDCLPVLPDNILLFDATASPEWVLCSHEFPGSPRVVIATDGDGQWMAVYEAGRWINAETEDEFDSVILAWTEQLTPPVL